MRRIRPGPFPIAQAISYALRFAEPARDDLALRVRTEGEVLREPHCPHARRSGFCLLEPSVTSLLGAGDSGRKRSSVRSGLLCGPAACPGRLTASVLGVRVRLLLLPGGILFAPDRWRADPGGSLLWHGAWGAFGALACFSSLRGASRALPSSGPSSALGAIASYGRFKTIGVSSSSSRSCGVGPSRKEESAKAYFE